MKNLRSQGVNQAPHPHAHAQAIKLKNGEARSSNFSNYSDHQRHIDRDPNANYYGKSGAGAATGNSEEREHKTKEEREREEEDLEFK